jgi:hypothetical protein
MVRPAGRTHSEVKVLYTALHGQVLAEGIAFSGDQGAARLARCRGNHHPFIAGGLLARQGDADGVFRRDHVIGAHSILLDRQLHAFDPAIELIAAGAVVR